MISTVDPEARHTRKSPENRRDGYRAHVAACPETGIITGERADPGRRGGKQRRRRRRRCCWPPAAARRGVRRFRLRHRGPARGNQAGRAHGGDQARPLKPAVEGGFTLDDFTVDETARTVTCPAGVTRPVTARRNVTFGAACRGCPLRARCTTNKNGRALILHPHDALLRAARATGQPSPGCVRTTGSTAPTSNGSSPRSPAAAGGASNSATSAPPATTPGSSTAPPP